MSGQARRATLWWLAGLALIAAPFTLGTYHAYLVNLALINIILAIGLNLLTGNSGQISLCHSSFMAIGAYGFTLLNNLYHWPVPLALVAAVALASLGGYAVGYPARRLSGIYLALATLAFLALTQVVIEEFPDLTGGIRGLKIEPMNWLGIGIDPKWLVYFLLLGCTALSIYVALQIMDNRLGRAFDAIRTSPQGAQALGIPVAQVKLTAFVISAAYAGLAGALLSMVVGFIDPVEFGVSAALRYITFIVIGGMGSVAGSIAGAVALTGLPEALRPVKEYSDLVYSALLLLSLLFMPNGLVGLASALRRKS
jgi:branched-chain amino acid transport system permease protein